MKPKMSLLPLDDALAQLRGFAAPILPVERVSTFEVDARVLREDLVSPVNVPPVDNSAMDGYALRALDVSTPNALLRVSQRLPAGFSGNQTLPLGEGEAARIFTGAPIPQGADAVVPQEDCERLGEDQVRIHAGVQVKPGQSIRRAGEDIQAGVQVLRAGERLNPAMLGMAASLGFKDLLVSARPRVALFSTGDELVMPGEVPPHAMEFGKIYNSNRFFLKALLIRAGCTVTDMGNIADKREQTVQALERASLEHDLILTSGGVSVGEEDHIKPSVQQMGELHQWSLAIKPGKPFAYGRIMSKGDADKPYTHFMGLPGNPVSSFITFHLLVLPFLAALTGVSSCAFNRVQLRANFEWLRADSRREFLRARRNADGALELFPNQSSGVLSSVVWGEGVVDNPAHGVIRRGDMVDFIEFEQWLK